jgi:hypothetical protein
VWQKLCITRSAEKPRQASSFISSRVMGPVVSWEPTVVISGSQLVPGRTPGSPQALPTIFWARVKPLPVSEGATGRMNRSLGGRPSWARTLSVSERPISSGMRPPARTSSVIVLGLSSKRATIVPAPASPAARSMVPA